MFPLSRGTPERPVLRPPRLSLTPQEAAEFFHDFARRFAGEKWTAASGRRVDAPRERTRPDAAFHREPSGCSG